ncbi:MAG: aldehyde dehydrogenase [Gemmatimonadetes bacterium]|nr:aldehyde dehydrogenase [Gemmatimonadota bacterium]|tara:strand:- start:175 stop:1581 length:1407 start_codon:yes stop_codon:yes gene_type:complete
MLHLPVIRAGKPYESLKKTVVHHIQTGESLVEVSQANRGLIARDLLKAPDNRAKLSAVPVADLIRMTAQAADSFMNDALPLGDTTQTPEDYVQQLSGTTGMPQSLVRLNMKKIRVVMADVDKVIDGLTRGLDLSVLDEGWTVQNGRPLSYICQADALGEILPSNSPGVHSLWVPTVALKVPLVLKPGREEPWTPYRIVQAFLKAGCPPEAFSYYPTDYSGAGEILMRCDRSMLFGGGSTVAPWKNDPRVQIHGPGQSKIIFGADAVDRWEEYLDVIVTSVSANGGRSCINTSSVWTPAHGDDIACALAERLGNITARPLDDPEAGLCAFLNVKLAEMIDGMIGSQLRQDGAYEVTTGDRLVKSEGLTYLRPAVVRAEPGHPLADSEFLFPFVSLVEVSQEDLLASIGPSLVVSAITEDDVFIRQLLDSSKIERLNIGALGTQVVSWDQPHEGNLFEHLYTQRALQCAG